jgi:hypothetical protein
VGLARRATKKWNLDHFSQHTSPTGVLPCTYELCYVIFYTSNVGRDDRRAWLLRPALWYLAKQGLQARRRLGCSLKLLGDCVGGVCLDHAGEPNRLAWLDKVLISHAARWGKRLRETKNAQQATVMLWLGRLSRFVHPDAAVPRPVQRTSVIGNRPASPTLFPPSIPPRQKSTFTFTYRGFTASNAAPLHLAVARRFYRQTAPTPPTEPRRCPRHSALPLL